MTDKTYIGVLLADLRLPEGRSLKGKRAPLNSLRDRVQGRFRASFSEVSFQDTWQRARVLITLAASSGQQAHERVDEIDRYLHGQEFEVDGVLVKSVDAVEDLWDVDSSR